MKFLFSSFLFLVFLPLASASFVDIDAKKQGGQYQVSEGTRVEIITHIPQKTDLLFLQKIPRILTNIEIDPLPEECSIIARKKVPSLILCAKTEGGFDVVLRGTGKGENQRGTGFSFFKYDDGSEKKKKEISLHSFYSRTGEEKSKVIENILSHDLKLEEGGAKKEEEASTISLSQKPSSRRKSTSSPKKISPESEEEKGLTLADIQGGYANPTNLPIREQILAIPRSNIILTETTNNIVGRFTFHATKEPLLVEKMTVFFHNVKGADSRSLLVSARLLYADGTPVVKRTGQEAIAFISPTTGGAIFEDLDLGLPERNLHLFVAVDIDEAISGRMGGEIVASLATGDGPSRVRGFWSQKTTALPLLSHDTPRYTVLRNKLLLEKTENQPEFLGSGNQQLLIFESSVQGDQEVFLTDVFATINISGSFQVTELRLKKNGDTIASLSGANLSGKQHFILPENGEALSERKEGFSLEATIEGDSFGTNDSLGALIEINSTSNGKDDVKWRSYGEYGNDGVSMQWIRFDDPKIFRIENYIR